MKQHTIDEVAYRLARREDPQTSHEGAQHAAKKLGELQAVALAAVQKYPGSTCSELADKLALRDPRQLGRRLPELERRGLITRGEARQCAITKRSAATWSA